jgi:hypothetical protein
LFLEEIDYYHYIDNYFIPCVSRILGLDRKILPNNFSPSLQLIDSFLSSVILKTEYKISTEKTKSSNPLVVITAEFSEPSIDVVDPEKFKLFNFALIRLQEIIRNPDLRFQKVNIDINLLA